MPMDDAVGNALATLAYVLKTRAKTQTRGEHECIVEGCTGTVKWWYGGPRAIRIACDNPECNVRMLS